MRWVAVIEWPVEDFVAPGEFVLTTGMGCDAGQLERLAAEVAEAGAAALCIATGAGRAVRRRCRRACARSPASTACR